MICAPFSFKIAFVTGHGEPQVLLFLEEVKQTDENNNKINKSNDPNKKQNKTKWNQTKQKKKTKTKNKMKPNQTKQKKKKKQLKNKTENCKCMFNITSE